MGVFSEDTENTERVGDPNCRDGGTLRKRRGSAIKEMAESYGGSYEGVLVSQLLIERDDVERNVKEDATEEPQDLVERLTKESEMLPESIGKAIGHICPEITIVYDNLVARGPAVQAKAALPSPVGVAKNVFWSFGRVLLRREKEQASVLKSISGVLRPVRRHGMEFAALITADMIYCRGGRRFY